MNCQEVQTNLSLYLYGELEFGREEALEQHLAGCDYCQVALAREKSWHTALNTERRDVPLDLLSQCRRDLRSALQGAEKRDPEPNGHFLNRLRSFWGWRQFDAIKFASARWSPRLAFASLFLFLGFTGSRWVDRFGLLPLGSGGFGTQAGLASGLSRVRDVQSADNNRVRITLDQTQEQQIEGTLDDPRILSLLLAGSKDPADPGLRVDSVEVLCRQKGADVRDALLFSVTHDENAAVRLKALEGLRQFREDSHAREVLLQVLETDANPAVRTQAIDVLVPYNGPVGPDLATTLETIVRSEPSDDNLRARCLQVLAARRSSAIY